MRARQTALPGLILIEPRLFEDHRGHFTELYHQDRYRAHGIKADFCQDNLSLSTRHVLRGLHYQWPEPQGKLVTVIEGEVLDVAVDLRQGSPTFGKWQSFTLSGQDHKQLWIPEGLAHGFLTLSDKASLMYKCTKPYSAAHDRSLNWRDPDLAIDWGPSLQGEVPILSDKDKSAPMLAEIGEADLPDL